jgi:hypothetical protein
MPRQPTRRHFLQTTATVGAALGLGDWSALLPLSPVTAAEATVTPDIVRFSPEIEPIVRLIEKTPREKCPAMMIEQLRKGLPYRHFLAALFLANVRAGEDHPLAVLHSANQLTLDAPVQERLLPTFWAMDSFKYLQERDRKVPQLKSVAGTLPSPQTAEAELHAGMEAFDPDRAERAIIVLVSTQGANRVIEPLWHYGARDWTFIGHYAIWVANFVRVLETIGWQHAEPTLRHVVTSIMGDGKNLKDEPYAANRERVQKAIGQMPATWAQGGSNPGVTKDLLALIRELKREEACQLALVQLLEGKAEAGAIWDAVHLAGGELIMMVPASSCALHSNTCANALHYAFQASAEPANRLLILLQAVGWMCLYRQCISEEGFHPKPKDITGIAGADIPIDLQAAADEILSFQKVSFFARRSAGPDEAARKAFTFAQRYPESNLLQRAAARLLPLKSSWDPHDIKFPVAMFENFGWVNPPWRPHVMAASVYSFQGKEDLDNPVVHRVREAIGNL